MQGIQCLQSHSCNENNFMQGESFKTIELQAQWYAHVCLLHMSPRHNTYMGEPAKQTISRTKLINLRADNLLIKEDGRCSNNRFADDVLIAQ